MFVFYYDLCFHINSLREKVWKKTVTFIILITNSIKSYGDKHKKKQKKTVSIVSVCSRKVNEVHQT